ncbi:kinesin-like protein kif17-like protein [Chrysochromulina tobinii]|uniref:Kinesin-like protein kif17-like protein n=1 Tax=Chrysochromulina tobinii TaxID=1460289 RepID=A0A0M0JNR9_9EUKA|nr:kinesin-like protein kif17-like protein [Chrysochromulina tobinii]|eukprot:KOO28234.1 kinesin-like protein kif17-like protein [Chrysochromulina sp. CCMP291]
MTFVSSTAAGRPHPGRRMILRVQGARQELAGKAVIVEREDPATGRWGVRLQDGSNQFIVVAAAELMLPAGGEPVEADGIADMVAGACAGVASPMPSRASPSVQRQARPQPTLSPRPEEEEAVPPETERAPAPRTARTARATARETNVRVGVRCRPMSRSERKAREQNVVLLDPSQPSLICLQQPLCDGDTSSPQKSIFAYDHLFNHLSSSEALYEELAAPLVDGIFDGYNATILAYGQTGSGKTHSMMGTPDDPGVIPRVADAVFDKVDLLEDGRSVRVCASYLQIYREIVHDLLVDDASGVDLKVRRDPKLGTYVQGLTEHQIEDAAGLAEIIERGNKKRAVASTFMNAESSRSHAIVIIRVEQEIEFYAGSSQKKRVFAKMCLVDLAGSERAKKSGAQDETLQEAIAINQSLSALGNVINALTDPRASKAQVVPYRASKLTQILEQSLGGNANTAMLATIAPTASNYAETLQTLQYAARAKQIANRAAANAYTFEEPPELKPPPETLAVAVTQVFSDATETVATFTEPVTTQAAVLRTSLCDCFEGCGRWMCWLLLYTRWMILSILILPFQLLYGLLKGLGTALWWLVACAMGVSRGVETCVLGTARILVQLAEMAERLSGDFFSSAQRHPVLVAAGVFLVWQTLAICLEAQAEQAHKEAVVDGPSAATLKKRAKAEKAAREASEMVDARCWHLTKPGESCAEACGSYTELFRLPIALAARARALAPPIFYDADEYITTREMASAKVVNALSSHYQLPTESLAHLDEACEGAMYLYLPELGSWDCYDGQSIDAVGMPFQSPCVCTAAPAVAFATAAVFVLVVAALATRMYTAYDRQTPVLRPEGVLVNALALEDLSGMTTYYDEPYSHATSGDELDSIPADAKWVFVGAYRQGSSTIAVGAFGRREEVVRRTHLDPRTEKHVAHEHNGVWWYRTDDASFGFAASPDVGKRGYLVDASNESDPARLSWGLHGLGGYRVGTALGVGAWTKMLYYTSRYGAEEYSLAPGDESRWLSSSPPATRIGAGGIQRSNRPASRQAPPSPPPSPPVDGSSSPPPSKRRTSIASARSYLAERLQSSRAPTTPAEAATSSTYQHPSSAAAAAVSTPNLSHGYLACAASLQHEKIDRSLPPPPNAPFSPLIPSVSNGSLVGLGSIWLNAVTTNDLALMTKHYEVPYSHATTAYHLDTIPSHAEWVFVGAREAGANAVALGAFGKRDDVLRRTPHNEPHEHNGVWWYRTDGYSFGFAPNSELQQYRADSMNPRDPQRLSWHLQGDGGWRAGQYTDLNGETPWRKLICYGSDPDWFTAAEAFRSALSQKRESPKYGLLAATTSILQCGPMVVLVLIYCDDNEYLKVRHEQPIVLVSALVSFATLVLSLTDLTTSEATSAGLRVRDEYVRSAQVNALMAVYFTADATLRALALLVLGSALGRLLDLVAISAVLAAFGWQWLRVLCNGGLRAACAVICERRRFLETFLRAVLPLIAPTVLQQQTSAQRRTEMIFSSAICAAMVLVPCLPATMEYMPHPLPWGDDVETHAVALLSFALAAKYLTFALGAFPALSDDAYGVIGVGAAVKEVGREAISQRSVGDSLQAPAYLPEPDWFAFTPGRGPIGSLCMWAVEAVYCTLVVLTLGLCGRRSDGTYWGSYSKPSASPEVPYSQLLEA